MRVDLASLPASFGEDLEAYHAWALGRDLFAPDGHVRPLAQGTADLRCQQIQSAVTALVQSGTPPGSLVSLADLVTPGAVRSILRHRFEQVGREANAYNGGIGKTLASIAREWVRVVPPVLEELKKICRRLPAVRAEMTEKNKALLRHFDDPETLPRLYQLPQVLWHDLEGKSVSVTSLAQAQAAVAIAILLYAPLRVANLAALEIGATLILPNYKDGEATIEIPARQTKNREPYKVVLPTAVTETIRTFERTFLRPLGSKLIFDNGQGQAKRKATVSGLIERTIWRHMGFKMTEHQFRHSSLKTAMRFYAELNTKRAARHHAILLERTVMRHGAITASRVRLRRRAPARVSRTKRGDAQ